MIENMLENYALILIILFYIIGSIPFAVVISKIFSLQDPRSFGSNNPGATNVMRSGNKIAGFLTFFFDLIKGFLPIFVLNITAAAKTGPIKLPLPTSSTPAIIFFIKY